MTNSERMQPWACSGRSRFPAYHPIREYVWRVTFSMFRYVRSVPAGADAQLVYIC